MTGKLLVYHLKSPRVPLVVRVPQFENHCTKAMSFNCGLSAAKYQPWLSALKNKNIGIGPKKALSIKLYIKPNQTWLVAKRN